MSTPTSVVHTPPPVAIATPQQFNHKMYAAALAYCGLPPNYPRVFKSEQSTDHETGAPLFEENGDPKKYLKCGSASYLSKNGYATWIQVNQPRDDAALTQWKKPKKAKIIDIATIRNITLDFEYPPAPEIAHRVGLALAAYCTKIGIAPDLQPVEDSGAGPHIVLCIPAIEITQATAKRWNEAVSAVVKQYIQPEFMRLCQVEGIEMSLDGFNIDRVLSLPGTWRPTNPKKADCAQLKQGYLRRWLAPYIGEQYPTRRENSRLAELIREAYAQLEHAQPTLPTRDTTLIDANTDARNFLTNYTRKHPAGTDRSGYFQTLVNTVYTKYDGDTVLALAEDINFLSGEKYNGRLDAEIDRSLGNAQRQISKPGASIPQQGTASLPKIILGEQLRDTRQSALDALAAKEKDNPNLFIQIARIKRIGRDERMTPVIIDVGEAELRNALTDSANYYRINAKGEPVPVAPPKEVVQSILGLKTEDLPFPPLEAIVQTPIMRPDGTILDTPGYDAPTHLYYMPQEGMRISAIPQSPTKSDVKAAMKFVQGFFQDFPYEGQADRANALGLELTTVTRQMYGHVPLALIDATKQGTGKGLHTDAIAITATGRSASAISQVSSDEEWDKRITAMLLSGSTMIVVDNVEGTLRSPILSKALTSEYHNGRLLGTSKMVDVPQRAIWIANGNNIQLGGDMPRRCYRIRMVSQVSNPFEREGFKYDHLDEAMKMHRGEIITALLTIARGWYAAGQPAPTKKIKKLATFSKWAEVIGGMLSYAGIDGFLENLDALHKEIDIDGAAWSLFLETWAEKLGTEAYTTKMLLEKIKECEALADVLPEPLATLYAKDEKTIKNKIGRALSKKNGTPFGAHNLRIVQGEDSHSKVATYKVAGYSNQYPAKSLENQAQNAGYAGYAGMETTYTQDEFSEKSANVPNNIHMEYGPNETRDTPHTPQSSTNSHLPLFNTPQSDIGVPNSPPDRACIRCGQRNWLYNPDVIGNYVCACMVSA